ncbi:hypothetical protein CEXT_619541 [Caerostris extrusa]|uniref:Uncharacterized protein n=1 Tax=Caerostris extrusa TaxID=172846 RepID=A0AAV4R405_CAEEX|nr:hypothetical protein CEXT_619541 [Caerostris extrusa]
MQASILIQVSIPKSHSQIFALPTQGALLPFRSFLRKKIPSCFPHSRLREGLIVSLIRFRCSETTARLSWKEIQFPKSSPVSGFAF